MMPKHSFRAPWGRRFTAMTAVSLLTLGACSDSDGGGAGPSTIATVGIVTLPNNQTLTNLIPGDKRKILGVPTNEKGNFIDKPVTLASSNPAVFTIVGDSIVAQLGGGSAYLRATSGGRTDSVLVGVRFRVATVTLTPAAPTLRREAAQALTAVQRDASGGAGAVVTGRPLTWTTSNAAVATVSTTGVVSASAAAVDGSTAVITATAPNTADGNVATVGTVTVTVTGDAAVQTVLVTAPGATADNGIGFRGNVGTVQLAASPRSGLNNVLVATPVWTTNNAAIATVNSAGLVTFAGGSGAVTITATVTNPGPPTNNVTGTAAFTVAPTLTNGVAVTAAAAAGAGVDYAFSASRVGATNFTVVSSGGTGDGDVYIFAPGVTNGTTSDAGGSNFACRSWNSGNGENCAVGATPAIAAGWFRIRMHAYTPSGAVGGMQITLTHP